MEQTSDFRMVPLAQLHESPFNPRRHFDDAKMAELVDSVTRLGVLTPLLARPNAKGYEIAAGHRRYRAAKKAGVPEVPVRIRVMTDPEFLEIITIENLQREDVHPLDEALGYQALMERAGYDVPAIAAKVAKSESYIYCRLKLADLVEPAKKAFLEDQITAGHAILIARLQPKDQKWALEACFPRYLRDGRCISVRELSQWIDQNVHLDLHEAPWKKDDAELVAAAGACTTCAKRTGFTPALFPDIAKKDTCTDRACFDQKLQAHVARKKIELEAEGEKLIEISTDYPGYGHKPKPGDPITSDRYHRIDGKKNRCDSARKAIVVAGSSDRGRVVDVCTDPKCTTHRGGGSRYSESAEGAKIRADEKRKQEKAARETKRRRRILDAILARAPKELGQPELELVVSGYLQEMQHDDKKELWRAHGWEPKKSQHGTDWSKAAGEAIAQIGAGGLVPFLLELALSRHVKVNYYRYAGSYDRSGDKPLLEAARRYKVDVKAIEKQLAQEHAEKAKAKKERSKKAAAKAKKAAPTSGSAEKRRNAKASAPKKKAVPAGEHACEVCGCTDSRACPGGCGWDPEFRGKNRYVCTNCVDEAE